jgi:hypothetical protein
MIRGRGRVRRGAAAVAIVPSLFPHSLVWLGPCEADRYLARVGPTHRRVPQPGRANHRRTAPMASQRKSRDDRLRARCHPQIPLPRANPPTRPSRPKSPKSANLGLLDQGRWGMRESGPSPIPVDKRLGRNSAAGLKIRASSPPESGIVPKGSSVDLTLFSTDQLMPHRRFCRELPGKAPVSASCFARQSVKFVHYAERCTLGRCP